jgi:hypothetical protein
MPDLLECQYRRVPYVISVGAAASADRNRSPYGRARQQK